MDEIVLTRLWMAGVVTMMLVFGVTVVVGILRQKREQDTEG
jgi:hypothetical protein